MFNSHFSELSQHILIILHTISIQLIEMQIVILEDGLIITFSWEMGAIKIFLFVSIFVAKNNLELATKECKEKCELSKLSYHEGGIQNHAMAGHSFRNFTLRKTYDCHVKCFDEKCRCQAFQISGRRCELLDEDRMSAPGDFVRKDGYVYFDMSREYVDQVWYFRYFLIFSYSSLLDGIADEKLIMDNQFEQEDSKEIKKKWKKSSFSNVCRRCKTG